MRPFADTVAANFVSWLPKRTYAERQGLHGNSAFGLSRTLPYADDADYPAAWEPSGAGFIAHLHGLNLSRAWAWRRLAEELPTNDPRVPPAEAAARTHAEAALPLVTGNAYEVEHYLAAYAVLLLT
jgi:hypothetical protein